MADSAELRKSLATVLAGRPLPIIRQAAAQVLTLVSNPESHIEVIANTILHDQAFTARILKVANSAYYRRQKEKVTTVTQAIAMTGFNTLRDIAIAAEFAELVQKRLPTSVSLHRLLAKAFIAGHQANALGQAISRSEAEALFTSALLESLGEFVMAAYLPKVFTKAMGIMQNTGLPYDEAHLQATGMTPHEVTEIVVNTLELPEGLLLPPPVWTAQGSAPDRPQAIVHLTNACATNLFGPESPQIVSQFETIMNRLAHTTGFEPDTITALLSQAYLKAVEFGNHVDLEYECFALDGTTSPLTMRHGFIGVCLELAEGNVDPEPADRPLL